MARPPHWRNSEPDTSDVEESASREAALQEKMEADLVNHLRKRQIFPYCEFVKDDGKEAKLVSLLYETHIYTDREHVTDGGRGSQQCLAAGQPQALPIRGSSESNMQKSCEVTKSPLLHSKAGGLEGFLRNLDVYEVYMTIPNEKGEKVLYKANVLVQRKAVSDSCEGNSQFLDVKEIRIYCADEDPSDSEAAFEIQLAMGNGPANPTAFIRYIRAPRPKQRMQKYRSGRFCRKRKQNNSDAPQSPKRMCSEVYDSEHSSKAQKGQNTSKNI